MEHGEAVITPLSISARDVLALSRFMFTGHVIIHVPEGVTVTAPVKAELQGLAQMFTGPVSEAGNAALAALVEIEGLRPCDLPSVVL